MAAEQCDGCGFDGADWIDAGAIEALAGLPLRWAEALEGLDAEQLQRRPVEGTWSVAEYTDHVREMVFGMRFILDIALTASGTELGAPPEPRFDAEPRAIDAAEALARFAEEVEALHDRLVSTPADAWDVSVIIGGEPVDVHWIARHAVHDVTHHLGDVARLRTALG